ncbi:MAG: hypothetical protein FRX48_06513 [Lasallia pustulata]|uniref:Retrovirus-related Pol polyprotein from transposon TNT 1-94-like beta-barrel domain-containing protein n=1 Tax=Lasallia pustulata TaxID=136370 RepID=A0A5M8PLL0_9LECA|nr:MAG: hypothetical protein FRX48_06513 [Lasallia pustulata]
MYNRLGSTPRLQWQYNKPEPPTSQQAANEPTSRRRANKLPTSQQAADEPELPTSQSRQQARAANKPEPLTNQSRRMSQQAVDKPMNRQRANKPPTSQRAVNETTSRQQANEPTANTDLGTQAVTAVALDDIIMAANLEEQKQKSRDDTKAFLSYQTNAITAKYAVNVANPKEHLQPVSYCNHCNKIGHLDEKCFILHPEMKKRPSKKVKAKKDKGRKRLAAEESDSPAGIMAFSGDEISETLDLGSFGFMAGQNGNGSLAQLAVLDTGCSQHCSSWKDFFTDLQPYHRKLICGIGKAILTPEAVGMLTIPVKINGNKIDFRLSNSFFCSGLGVTLISVQQILQMKGRVFFDNDKASIIHPKYTLLAPLQHGLFLLNIWDPSALT